MGVGDNIKAAAAKATGKVKETVGDLTDNEKLVAEGKADQLKGEATEAKGDVKDAAKDVKHDVKDAFDK